MQTGTEPCNNVALTIQYNREKSALDHSSAFTFCHIPPPRNPPEDISFIHSFSSPSPIASRSLLARLSSITLKIPADLFGLPLLFHPADFHTLRVRRLLGGGGGGAGTGVGLTAA